MINEENLKSSNQHYITKSYLDKFIHPNSEQAVLYPYRRGGMPCKPRGTKRCGCAIDFYTQKVNGVSSDQLDEARGINEKLFFSSGKRTPSVLSKIIYENHLAFDKEEKEVLAAVAAFLFCGSPVQIHNSAMLHLFAAQVDVWSKINLPETLAYYEERYGLEAKRKLEEDRKSLYEGGLFLDVEPECKKQLGFESFEQMELWIKCLSLMNLTVVECHYKSFFTTSDNPVIVFSNARSTEKQHNIGLKMKDAKVWFPISWNKGLLWHWDAPQERTGFGYSETHKINHKVAQWCYKFVYSPQPVQWLAIKDVVFDPLRGHYGSLKKFFELSRPCFDLKSGKQIGDVIEIMSALRSGIKQDILGGTC